MRKIIISIALVGFFGFFALQQAEAGRGRMGPGPYCPAWESGYGQFQDGAAQKDIDAFLLATVELRKKLVMKHAEYDAVMSADIPDPAKAAEITGEIFQLRDQLRTKAKDAGLGTGYGQGYPCNWGRGRGYGPGGGRGYGYGPGGGRGYCRGFFN